RGQVAGTSRRGMGGTPRVGISVRPGGPRAGGQRAAGGALAAWVRGAAGRGERRVDRGGSRLGARGGRVDGCEPESPRSDADSPRRSCPTAPREARQRVRSVDLAERAARLRHPRVHGHPHGMAGAGRSRAHHGRAVGPARSGCGAVSRLRRGVVRGRTAAPGWRRRRVATHRPDPRGAGGRRGLCRRIPFREGLRRKPLGLRHPQGCEGLSPPLPPPRRNISGQIGVSMGMESEMKHPAARRRDARVNAILIVAALWTLLHVYVGQRLLAPTSLAPGWRLLGWVGILLLILAPFVALFAGRTERLPTNRGLEVAGFTAMGLSSLLIVFALAGDALHVRAWLGVGTFQLGVVGSAVAVLVIGLWRARRPAIVRVVDVPIRGLPSDLEG